MPYITKLADQGVFASVKADPALARGVNTFPGKLTYKAVAEAFGFDYTPLDNLL